MAFHYTRFDQVLADPSDEDETADETGERILEPRRLWASLRIVLGAIFAWAFVDKTFGLGFGTEAADAWVRGGSPTQGFLAHATQGPLADVFAAMAGHPVVDVLFMVGLAGIGVALLAGICMRIAAYAGASMMLLMWLAVLPKANNPLLDDHVVYGLVLLVLPLVQAGRTWGLGAWWADTRLVQAHPILE